MANQEHLAKLKEGVDAWDDWVLEQPDPFRADLSGALLRDLNLQEANLIGADLGGANLIGADLSNSYLWDALLSGALLMNANLSRAQMQRADFSGAHIGNTVFAKNDLSTVKGLETVRHSGPSSIGIDTIYLSKGNVPEAFLRGAGIPDNFIEYLTSLTEKAFEFYSCFLSHGEPDSEFADRLRRDLVSNAVSCWHYRYDMRGGPIPESRTHRHHRIRVVAGDAIC